VKPKFSRCELFLWGAGDWGRGYISGTPAVAKQRLFWTVTDWEHYSVCDTDYFCGSPCVLWLDGKVNLSLYLTNKAWKRMEEWMYRSTSSWPWHQLEWSGQLHAPTILPGKSPRYRLYRRLREPQGQPGRYGEVKVLDPTGTRTPIYRATATDPEARVRFQALPDFLRSSRSGTVSAQPREYNWGATW
jgi:hypothetical protein